jgi:hypothetical protein
MSSHIWQTQVQKPKLIFYDREEGYDEIILLPAFVIKRSPLSLTASLLFSLNALQKQNVPPIHRTSLCLLVLNT